MDKNYVNSSFSLNDVMKLDFFAERFRVPVEKLSWGVIEYKFRDEVDSDFSPAVLIEGQNLYIDIESDKISALTNVCGYIQTAHVAEMAEQENEYYFKANDAEALLDKAALWDVYRSKVLTQSLIDEARKLN